MMMEGPGKHVYLDETPVPLKGRDWRAGDRVEVFYRLMEAETGGYFPVARAAEGVRSPRFARTDGWVPGIVERDFTNAPHNLVMVRHTHPLWCNARGEWLDMDDDNNCIQKFVVTRVRAPEEDETPLLSLVLVRWGGADSPEACNGTEDGAWGRSGSTVSGTYLEKILSATYAALGTRYETWTAFVETTAEMDRLCERRVVSALRGRHQAAMYLLWPTQFDDGYAGRPGMVPWPPLLGLMGRLEGAGLASRFPHASSVYRALLSKEWTSTLGGSESMKVPQTTRVNRAMIDEDSLEAARLAAEAIGLDVNEHPIRGVAKLGFSWEATDVRSWRGLPDLANALETLSRQPGCFADFVFVQEFVEAVGEIRAYTVHGDIVKLLYTRFERPTEGDEGCFCEFAEFTRETALADWFGGSEAVLEAAEQKVRELVKKWLVWLRSLSAEPQPFCRVDVFITVKGDEVDVFTGELTEMGASCLGWKEGPQLVFEAFLESCFKKKCDVADCPCSSIKKKKTRKRRRFLPENGAGVSTVAAEEESSSGEEEGDEDGSAETTSATDKKMTPS